MRRDRKRAKIWLQSLELAWARGFTRQELPHILIMVEHEQNEFMRKWNEYPRLRHGRPEERQNWELIGEGDGIHWPELDEDLSVEGLLAWRRSGESPSSFDRWLESRR